MNVRLFFIYKLIKDLVPIYPVYLLLFESKGLTLAQISLLLAIWSVAVVLLEVPSGILADHWNRKNMILIGGLCKVGCYIFWFFSEGFVLYALGFILWGISESFCSGSEEALLYDNLKLQGQEESFDKVYGKGNFYASIGVALSCLIGGFLSVLITFKGVLLLSVFSVLISTFFASKLKEVNYFKIQQDENREKDSFRLFATMVDAVTLCIKNRLLLIVILMLVLVIGTAGILDEYDSLIAKSYGLNLELIGVWICIRYILEAIGGRFAYLYKKLFIKIGIKKEFYSIFLLCIFAGICLAISVSIHSIALVPLYGLFYMFMASAGILQEEYIQKRIDEQGRSTVHSIISLLHNLYGITFFSVFALVISGSSIQLTILMIALYIIILSVVLGLMHRLITKKDIGISVGTH